MSYDLREPASIIEETARSLPRSHQVDLPPHLVAAGTVLALAGHTRWAAELWARALAPGMPPFRHYYGIDPILGACAGAGLTKSPDGTDITTSELERIEVVTRIRLNLPMWPPAPGQLGRPRPDVLDPALSLVRPREGAVRYDEAPAADEVRALAMFDAWLRIVGPLEAWEKPQSVAVLLLSADIAERLGDRVKSSGYLQEWVGRAVGQPPIPIDGGSFFGLRALSRMAADHVLIEWLGLTDADCEAAGRRLVDLADRRISGGRAAPRRRFDWVEFLRALSTRVLEEEGDHSMAISDHQRQTRWLGADPASAQSIARAEDRLGRRLPPSYVAFLRATNGFGPVSHFVHRLRPVQQIDWFANEDPETIGIWLEGRDDDQDVSEADYRVYGNNQPAAHMTHLRNALQVSDEFDGSVILLNPEVIDQAGEWETWHFAPWLAGAQRFASFRDFMEEGTLAQDT